MYKLLRPLLFFFPPEGIHRFSMFWVNLISRSRRLKSLLRFALFRQQKSLVTDCFGLHFRNPLGLGAGFDKNARYLEALDMLGFGFVEIGTVTPHSQSGQPKPRLFRLPRSRALINRMGFNNDGAAAIARRLRAWKSAPVRGSQMLIGGNIGKNKDTPNGEAWKDYLRCFEELADCVDFIVINVSSPNTPGLRELQETKALSEILLPLEEANARRAASNGAARRPILLKLSPDLDEPAMQEIMGFIGGRQIDGLVLTNTSSSRDHLDIRSRRQADRIGAGGLSGQPLSAKSTHLLRQAHELGRSGMPLVASGGVFTADDFASRLQAGASLVEVWTGFIYEGPGIVRKILEPFSRDNP
jgi:dihydroorotate dehydrogenase